MTIPSDLFSTNCEGNWTIHAKDENRGASCGREPDDADIVPTKMVTPTLTPGMEERYGAAGLRICSRSACSFAQGTGNAREGQVVESGSSVGRFRKHVIHMKRGFLPRLG